MLAQNPDKGKIIHCGRREKKKKAGMIHMPSCAVVNEHCQMIDLNVYMSSL